MLIEKRILVAPLDWGLGHASRCIPIINDLLEKGKEVILAADGEPLRLLTEKFPDLKIVRLKGITIRYPNVLPFSIYFGLKLPQLIQSLKKEQEEIKDIVLKYGIEAIISDNRYGLYHQGIKSILITHQLFIKSPILEKQVQRFIHKQINKFDECWVPDYEGVENLSGALSHGESRLDNLKYIGPLSRFKKAVNKQGNYRRKLMVILSGPEPARSQFEKKIITQLLQINISSLVVQGVLKNGFKSERLTDHLEVVSYLPSQKMEEEVQMSEIIVCRSGYSSIMDLHLLGKKAIIIPTKGQTEQEYLAGYLSDNNNFYAVEEAKLNLASDLRKLN